VTPVFGHGRLRLYLLKLLAESPRHGYDVIRDLEDRFLGLYAPSAGTVYPRLSRLEVEGLVTHAEEEGRKVYRITDAGRAELAARQGELDDIEEGIVESVRDLGSEIRSEVRGSVRDLRDELKSAARDMRRERRHEGRSDRAGSGARHDPGRREVENLVDWFRAEVREVARRSTPTSEEIAALKAVVEVALDEVRRVLAGADRRG
jgi:DNA-binding PadR family transcriptional regulator